MSYSVTNGRPGFHTLKETRTVPTVRAQFFFWKPDGGHEIFEFLVGQCRQSEPFSDSFDHFKVLGRIR